MSGALQLDQPLQAVVAVDDAAVEVVEVRGREPAAVERHQRAQLGRDHRHHLEHHPLGLVARFQEGLDHLQALDELLALGLGAGLQQLAAHGLALDRQVELLEHVAHGLGADAAGEGVVAELLAVAQHLLLVQQLVGLERGQAGLDHDPVVEVEHALEVAQRHVEQHADARRHRLQEPDVRDRRGQLDMAHALAADLGLDDLDAALLADDALVLHALVLAAQALVVLDRAEDLGAEQPVALRLEGPVVDRLGLPDLAIRPLANLVGARDGDPDLVELLAGCGLAEEVHQVVHRTLLSITRRERPIRPGRAGTARPSLGCEAPTCSSMRPEPARSLAGHLLLQLDVERQAPAAP